MVNSTVYLFVGLTFSILGVLLLMYTFVLWIHERKQQNNHIQNAVASSLEFEQELSNQPLHITDHTTTLNSTAHLLRPTSESQVQFVDTGNEREQLVMALELLIQQRTSGYIDEDTYNKQKNALFSHPITSQVVVSNIENNSAQPSTADELYVDYMEGIIGKSEYERRKSQTNKQDH